jgi:hypothetical protein
MLVKVLYWNYSGDWGPHADHGPHIVELCRKALKESTEAPNSEISTARFAVPLHSCVLHIAHKYACSDRVKYGEEQKKVKAMLSVCWNTRRAPRNLAGAGTLLTCICGEPDSNFDRDIEIRFPVSLRATPCLIQSLSSWIRVLHSVDNTSFLLAVTSKIFRLFTIKVRSTECRSISGSF